MIEQRIEAQILGNDEIAVHNHVVQNNIPILEENYIEKMNAGNGWTKGRMFRKIASIPLVAHMEATEQGYDLENEKDLRRFLELNPDYMTVERLSTASSERGIIIK